MGLRTSSTDRLFFHFLIISILFYDGLNAIIRAQAGLSMAWRGMDGQRRVWYGGSFRNTRTPRVDELYFRRPEKALIGANQHGQKNGQMRKRGRSYQRLRKVE
jgi:hypothetical protein